MDEIDDEAVRRETRYEPRPLYYYDETVYQEEANRSEAQGGPPHWFVHSTQAQLSYTWALIRSFSDSFAHAVPFTNYTHRISDVPKSGFLHVSLAGYISSLRTLCLSSTKQELKHLILDRTACEPEKE